MFPMRIAAVQTKLAITDVVALSADAQLIFNINNGLGQVLRVFTRGAKQVEGDALSGLLPDAGEPFTFLNQPGKRLSEVGH